MSNDNTETKPETSDEQESGSALLGAVCSGSSCPCEKCENYRKYLAWLENERSKDGIFEMLEEIRHLKDQLAYLSKTQAEIISLIPEEIQRMLDNEGLYIGSNPDNPTMGEAPIVSMGGKVYSMLIDKELDPTRFIAGHRLDGPFRAGTPTDLETAKREAKARIRENSQDGSPR